MLIGAIAVLAMLVVGGAGALAVALTKGSGSNQVAGPNPATAKVHPTHARDHAVRPTPSPSSTSTSASTTTTTPPNSTTTAPVPVFVTGTNPVITGLSPSSGNAGQTIQISGGNFKSANGQIVATFGGTAAGTSCSSSSTCTVTVPTGVSGVVPVTITTAGGISNTVTFNFG